jgi:hypothetical protein
MLRVTLLADRLFGVRVAVDVCCDGSVDDSSLGWGRQLFGVLVSVSLSLRAPLQVGQRACDAVSLVFRENRTRPHAAVEALHLSVEPEAALAKDRRENSHHPPPARCKDVDGVIDFSGGCNAATWPDGWAGKKQRVHRVDLA